MFLFHYAFNVLYQSLAYNFSVLKCLLLRFSTFSGIQSFLKRQSNTYFYNKNHKYIKLDDVLSCCDLCITIFEYLELKDIVAVSSSNSTIYKIILHDDVIKISRIQVPHENYLIWIAKRSKKNLTYIAATHAAICMISNNSLLTLAKYCPNLKEISLIENRVINSEGLRPLVENCSQIVSLILSKVPLQDFDIISIAPYLKQLKYLDLQSCSKLTDRSMAALSIYCRLLIKLDLSYCNLLTDTGVEAIANNCTNLESISLIKCHMVTDKSAAELSRKCQKLKELCMSRTLITDVGVISIAENCRDLQLLEISHNDSITDASISLIAFLCSDIRVLRVSWCVGVTDESIFNVAINCAYIEQLFVRDCFM